MASKKTVRAMGGSIRSFPIFARPQPHRRARRRASRSKIFGPETPGKFRDFVEKLPRTVKRVGPERVDDNPPDAGWDAMSSP